MHTIPFSKHPLNYFYLNGRIILCLFLFFCFSPLTIFSQQLTVAKKEQTPIKTDKELKFSTYRKNKELENRNKRGSDTKDTTAAMALDREKAVRVDVNQVNLHFSIPAPTFFDNTNSVSVKLTVGFSPKGDESFSDTFTLNESTRNSPGAAMYIQNNVVHFDISALLIDKDPVYCTVTYTPIDGKGNTEIVEAIYNQ